MASMATSEGDTPLARRLDEEALDDQTASELPRLLAHRSLGFLEVHRGTCVGSCSLRQALVLAGSLSPAFAREIECSRAATSSTTDEIAESLVVLDRAASESPCSGSPIIAQWAHTIAAELCVREGDGRGGAPSRRRLDGVVGRHRLRVVHRLCAEDHRDPVGRP